MRAKVGDRMIVRYNHAPEGFSGKIINIDSEDYILIDSTEKDVIHCVSIKKIDQDDYYEFIHSQQN